MTTKVSFNEAFENVCISLGLAYLYIFSCFLTYGFFFTTDPLANFLFFIFKLGIGLNILIFIALAGLLLLGELKGLKYFLGLIYLSVLLCPWMFMIFVTK